ncbi:hypothetical protein HPB48_001697 [Haemaphysalis longicornis]|uniref:Peptidase A2 domain-containing protein n=1 Tax=Haemaphysalis longicornis TaxID=44386 RepID=A0A9J6GTJ3_HAELO|nr:hypothetical protein HPB48_001697 [Haemaphysalis longicornis]
MRLVWQRASREGHLSCQRLRLPEVREKGPFPNRCRSTNALRNIEQEPGFLGLMATTASSRWEVSPLVESQTLVFKIDTGADETVIPERQFRQLFKHVVLTSPDRVLQGPDGKTLRISGLARLHFKLNGRESMEKVYILPGLRTALLGKPAITNLGLFSSVNNVSVPLPPYEQTRAELQRMCLETFSELIRERYLSPEEMSYIYGYNQPSKQDTEHRPPKYIADPILFRLSTPPWAPRGGPPPTLAASNARALEISATSPGSFRATTGAAPAPSAWQPC